MLIQLFEHKKTDFKIGYKIRKEIDAKIELIIKSHLNVKKNTLFPEKNVQEEMFHLLMDHKTKSNRIINGLPSHLKEHNGWIYVKRWGKNCKKKSFECHMI